MSNEVRHVVVLGAGGMGALFGAILAQGGLNVTLCDSDVEHVTQMNEKGLKIVGYGGDRLVPVTAVTHTRDIKAADVILIQCKSHATRVVAQSIKHLVEDGAVCVSFQNGLGNEEIIAEHVGAENVLGGLTAMAGYKISPGVVRDFSRVPSAIGEMSGGLTSRVTRLAQSFTSAGLETNASADIQSEIWKKLLGNIAMSAVSGITDLTSAQSLRINELHETSLRALDEALAVAASCNILLDRESVVKSLALITEPGGTGDNKSSLCVDLLNHRPTEVDFIYGSVITRAAEHGVPVPTLKTLSSLVKGIESHYTRQG